VLDVKSSKLIWYQKKLTCLVYDDADDGDDDDVDDDADDDYDDDDGYERPNYVFPYPIRITDISVVRDVNWKTEVQMNRN
jgi:hypothetical protein